MFDVKHIYTNYIVSLYVNLHKVSCSFHSKLPAKREVKVHFVCTLQLIISTHPCFINAWLSFNVICQLYHGENKLYI